MSALVPALAVGLSVGSATLSPATADPASNEEAPTTPSSYRVPSADELAAQRAEATRLAAEVTNQEKAVADAQAKVTQLQNEANEARAQEEAAKQAETAAREEAARQTERYEAAKALVTQSKGDMGRWASQTYRNGGTSGIEDFMSLMESQNTDDLSQRAQMLQLVGRWRGSVVDSLEEAEAVQADAKAKADQASADATRHAAEAESARLRADQLVTEQTTTLMYLNMLLEQKRSEASAASAQGDAMSAAMLAATSSMTNPTNVITGPTYPDCPGGDISGYPNGQIPTSLLCAVRTARGHMLRADAAYAFDQMSLAYQSQFGTPICITDSYRPYAVQVTLKAQKPHLAARPGTSNHGLGRATDLCGGIQSFGTPQHQWMVNNAPTYGWCLPTWARSTGSKPEPWHWQYHYCG